MLGFRQSIVISKKQELLIKLAKLANSNNSDGEANSAARRVCKLLEDLNYLDGWNTSRRVEPSPESTQREYASPFENAFWEEFFGGNRGSGKTRTAQTAQEKFYESVLREEKRREEYARKKEQERQEEERVKQDTYRRQQRNQSNSAKPVWVKIFDAGQYFYWNMETGEQITQIEFHMRGYK